MRRDRQGRVHRFHADDTIKHQIFGPSPNRDLLHSLQVSDSAPVLPSYLQLETVAICSLQGSVLTRRGPNLRLEALAPGAKLTAPLKIDEYLFSQEAEKLGFDQKRSLVERLPVHCQRHSSDLIAREKDFYSQARAQPLVQFYERLEALGQGLADGQFLLQMAWGTGWQGMTLGSAIAGSREFATIRASFRSDRPGTPFPRSRRLVQRGQAPSMPLGWLRLEMKPR